jgi:hypothetical protein
MADTMASAANRAAKDFAADGADDVAARRFDGGKRTTSGALSGAA